MEDEIGPGGDIAAVGRPAPGVQWSTAKRYYTLAILCLVLVIAFVDRQIISILVEPIKADLHLSDTQIGLLTGFAFASFYVIAGVPLARIADTGVRRTLIASCTAFWSVATILCGSAHSFWQLAMARFGVATGEAGASPAIQSMVADLFPLTERGKAMGILMAAQSLGIAGGLFLGGLINQAFGWRMVFLMIGLPGILVAALLMLTVAEPPRGMADRLATTKDLTTNSARHAIAFLWRQRSYRAMLFAFGCLHLTGYGVIAWFPAFLMRVHHLTSVEVGSVVGGSLAAGLILGSLAAAAVVDRLGRRDVRGYMWIAGGSAFAMAPLAIAFCFWPSVTGTVAIFVVYNFVAGFVQPPSLAMVQAVAQPQMRGTATFGATLVQNLTGGALGPLLVGLMNDALTPSYGPQAVRYSIAVVTIGAAVAGLAFAAANRWIEGDIATVTGR